MYIFVGCGIGARILIAFDGVWTESMFRSAVLYFLEEKDKKETFNLIICIVLFCVEHFSQHCESVFSWHFCCISERRASAKNTKRERWGARFVEAAERLRDIIKFPARRDCFFLFFYFSYRNRTHPMSASIE